MFINYLRGKVSQPMQVYTMVYIELEYYIIYKLSVKANYILNVVDYPLSV